MASWNEYEPKLKKSEGYGKYTNSPTDLGRETMSGVTLTKFREVFGSDMTVANLKAMTYAQWKYIMKGGYWDKCGCDLITNQSVAEIIADWCINSGTGIIKKVQGIVGVKQDGVVGKLTIAAINGADQMVLHGKIKRARLLHYISIVDSKPSQYANFSGWIRRVGDLVYKKN